MTKKRNGASDWWLLARAAGPASLFCWHLLRAVAFRAERH
jgi:hypothetical protein